MSEQEQATRKIFATLPAEDAELRALLENAKDGDVITINHTSPDYVVLKREVVDEIKKELEYLCVHSNALTNSVAKSALSTLKQAMEGK